MELPAAFDLRALEVFVTVARAGGMTEAGRILGLTQSAVSQAVANLEQALGVALLDRSVRPAKLTRHGQILRERAVELLSGAALAVNATRNASEDVFDHLSIAMADSVAFTLGPELVRVFSEAIGHWQIRSGLTNEHERDLMSGAVDLAFFVDEALDGLVGFERHHILTEELILATPADYEPASGTIDKEALKRLAESLRLVRYSLRSASGRNIERHLNRLRVSVPMWLECDSPLAQVSLISKGEAWGFMTPLFCLQTPHLLERVALRRLSTGRFSRSVYLVAREGALGGLPARVAEVSREIVRDTIAPAVGAVAPGLEEAITTP